MGFFRGAGVVILSIALFVVVLAGNGFLMVGSSLQYDNVVSVATENFEDILPDGVFDAVEGNLGYMTDFCSAHENLNYEDETLGEFNVPCETVLEGPEEIVNFLEGDNEELGDESVREVVLMNITENYDLAKTYCSEGGEIPIETDEFDFDLRVSCDAILSGSSEELRAEFLESMIYEVYHDEYDCESPFSCGEISDAPFYFVSDQARSYWMGKFWLMFVIALVIFGLMVLLIEGKSSAPIIAGAIVVVAALPFLFIDNIILSFIEDSLVAFIGVFVGKSSFVFSLGLIVGLVGIGIGIGMKAFGFGFWLSKKFKS